MSPTPGPVVKLAAARTALAVTLRGGERIYGPRPAVGGASASCSTAGSEVVARTRLLISISPPAVLVAAADEGDADDDD